MQNNKMSYGATAEQPITATTNDVDDETGNGSLLVDAEPTPEDKEELSEEEKRANFIKKSIVAFILVAIVGFVVADSLTNQYVLGGIETFLEWIEANPGPGVLVFILVYFGATVLFVPGSILTLGAGFVFANAFGLGRGVALGVFSVFVGASAGAIAAFLLGRFLLRDWVTGLTQKYAIFEALDNAFEEKGFRIMALLRLSPIIPFNAINYIAGVTAISFWAYLWALIAILPGTTLYVFLGASAGSLTESASSGDNATVTIIVVVVGIVFGFAAVAVTSYYAKQELNKVAARRSEEQHGSEAGDIEVAPGSSDDDNNSPTS